jgi:uncharacterized protein YggE
LYQIKFNSVKKIDELVDLLDDNATAEFRIAYTSHTKIIEYRKQLKIMALKAAKEKAKYLAEAINEQVGEAIKINEPKTNYGKTDFASNSVAFEFTTGTNENDFKKIRLVYEVEAIFSLK